MLKKQRSGFTFYILFFIASIIGEAYCLLEFRDDAITILGMGVVSLIAAYLAIDSYRKEKSIINSEAALYKMIDEHLTRNEKIQEAQYVAIKKNTQILKNELENIRKENNK